MFAIQGISAPVMICGSGVPACAVLAPPPDDVSRSSPFLCSVHLLGLLGEYLVRIDGLACRCPRLCMPIE